MGIVRVQGVVVSSARDPSRQFVLNSSEVHLGEHWLSLGLRCWLFGSGIVHIHSYVLVFLRRSLLQT